MNHTLELNDDDLRLLALAQRAGRRLVAELVGERPVHRNGRHRHVGGDVLSTGVSVDVNTIPTDLVDRLLKAFFEA